MKDAKYTIKKSNAQNVLIPKQLLLMKNVVVIVIWFSMKIAYVLPAKFLCATSVRLPSSVNNAQKNYNSLMGTVDAVMVKFQIILVSVRSAMF